MTTRRLVLTLSLLGALLAFGVLDMGRWSTWWTRADSQEDRDDEVDRGNRSATAAHSARSSMRRAAPTMTWIRTSTVSTAPAATLLVRLMVGGIFLSEGIQKFLFPDELGVGRFLKIGIPAPHVMAPFVGVIEISCGALLLLGLLTRLAALPLIIDMLVAIVTTKIPILLQDGFWKMAHEARTDYAMLLGSLFLLIVGAGPWSCDAWLTKRRFSRTH